MSPSPRPRPAAAVSAASSAGVRDCLTPHLDRRQVFEEEFKAQQLHQAARLKRGHGLPPDPGFAFGISMHGDQPSVKALLCPSSVSSTAQAESPESSPQPRRHSQGLRLPPTYVFGRGKHEGQYKGAASDGVAGALSYVGGGAVLERPPAHHAHATPDLVFGLRSRRDEEGSMKACLHGVYAEKGGPETEQRREGQAERQLAAAAVFGSGRGGRARAAAEGTAAQLLAPDAVGFVGADDDDEEFLRPRGKGDLRRIFLQRLGPQCGLGSEGAFERVFARAAAVGGPKDGAPRCSIHAFRAALDAEQRGAVVPVIGQA